MFIGNTENKTELTTDYLYLPSLEESDVRCELSNGQIYS